MTYRHPFYDAMHKVMEGAEKRMDEAGIPKARPVRVVECHVCQGTGWIETHMNDVGIGSGHDCAYCAGRGRIATEGGEA